MGNNMGSVVGAAVAASIPSNSNSSSRTHYRVRCGYCSCNTVYDGYSRSEYDYYRNSSIRCESCAADYSRRQKERAQAKIEEEKRREIARRKQKMAALERQKREKLEAERIEREFQRDLERQRLMDQQQAEKDKRMNRLKEMQQKQAEELRKEAERMKSLNEKRKSQSKEYPFLKFKKLQTVETLKSICEQVSKCAVVGQVITNTVNDVADELKQSLKDEYSVVEPQINRYKKYGEELSNMKGEFTKAFKDVFEGQEDDIDEIAELMTKDPDGPEEYAEEMKVNMEKLVDRMNDMESKLFLMSQYYEQISLDYKDFIDFCSSKKLEFAGIPGILRDLAGELKAGGKRDIDEGLNDDEKFEQNTEFSATYTAITANTITETETVRETRGNKAGKYALIGAAIGAGGGMLAGAAIGTACGGPVGTVIGAAIGGTVLGGLFGALIGGAIGAAKSQTIEKTYTTTKVENQEQQVVLEDFLEKTTYDGSKHSDALEKIMRALEPKLDEYADQLKQQQISANQELMKMERLKRECESMQKVLNDFRKETRDIIKADISKNQAKMMKKKWDSFKDQLKAMFNNMK